MLVLACSEKCTELKTLRTVQISNRVSQTFQGLGTVSSTLSPKMKQLLRTHDQ